MARIKSGIKNPRTVRPTKLTKNESDAVIKSLLERLDCPRALTVWLMYEQGSHLDLVSLDFNFLWFDRLIDGSAVSRARSAYCATKLLSKCKNLRTKIDTKEVALRSAREAEAHCLLTNTFLRDLRSGSVKNSTINSVLFHAQGTVARILGTLRPGIFRDPGFSQGRTSSAFGDEKTIMHKYMSRLDVTPRSLQIALRVFGDSPHWGQAALDADGPCSMLPGAFELVSGNTMTVVSKNAKTDRVICYEPHCNIRLQLAVGNYLKRRLSLNGIDLLDQSVNQRRAQLGSKFGNLATIDLRSASDTVSIELVRDLVPSDWFELLDSLRSPYTKWPDGSVIENQKFSSMGNGFTFELESLIFYAIASAVSENVSVYGDDIIVPTEKYSAVVETLTSVGFIINDQKSFCDGPFRESCGFDALHGHDVTPFFIRKLPSYREDVVKIHNAARNWAAKDPSLAWAKTLREIRNNHSYHLGPAALADGSPYGDGHYHVNFEEATPQRAANQIDGWWFKSVLPRWKVNRFYGDRVVGNYSGRFASAALCAALGPKAARSVFDIAVDRREVTFVTTRTLASFHWPSVTWTDV